MNARTFEEMGASKTTKFGPTLVSMGPAFYKTALSGSPQVSMVASRTAVLLMTGTAWLGLMSSPGMAIGGSRPLALGASSGMLAQAAVSEDLTFDSQGSEVQEVQQGLQTLGYYEGLIDGLYGDATAEAIAAFQAAEGLPVDGLASGETRDRLQQALAAAQGTQLTQSQSTEETATPETTGDAEASASKASAGLGFGFWLLVILVPLLGAGIGLAAFWLGRRQAAIAAQPESNHDLGDSIADQTPSNSPLDTAAPQVAPDRATVQPAEGSEFSVPLAENAQSAVNGVAKNLWVSPPSDFPVEPDASGRRKPRAAEAIAETTPVPEPSASLTEQTTRLPSINIVDELIQDLRSPNPSKRRKAIWELGQRGDSKAIQPLVDLMLDSDSRQRSLILGALSEIGGRTLKPMSRALAISLQDDNAEVRKNAIRDLTRIYDVVGQISQLLRHALDDSDTEVRDTAQWALGQLSRIRGLPTNEALPSSSETKAPELPAREDPNL